MSSKDKKGAKVQPQEQTAQGGGLSQNISDKLRRKREERKHCSSILSNNHNYHRKV